MPHVVRKIVASMAGVALLACLGCGAGGLVSGPDASTEQATVKGKVTAHGKPLTAGQVNFDASNISRREAGAVQAPIGKDGSYTIKTYVGSNRITVESPQLKGTEGYTEYNLDVKSGENTFDIVIPKP